MLTEKLSSSTEDLTSILIELKKMTKRFFMNSAPVSQQ